METTLTKGHKLDKIAKQYIIDCIDPSAYIEEDLKTDIEKIEFLKDTFYSEYGWRVKQVGQIKALTDWLQGLPTCLHIEFYNYDIIQLAIKWGSLPKDHKESQSDKILNNYWNLLANKINQLFNKIKD